MVVRVSPSGTQPVMWLGLAILVFQVAVAGWCLRAVARQEDDLLQGRMRFCATVIHDVRQPLQAATLFLDGLTHAQPGSQTVKATQGLEQSILSVRHILEDFHDLARLDAAAGGVHMQDFNLAAMLHALEAEFAAQAISKNLRFCFYCPSTDIRVHSDPQWVQTIVRKLLIHAMAQTQHGGVLLGLRQRDVFERRIAPDGSIEDRSVEGFNRGGSLSFAGADKAHVDVGAPEFRRELGFDHRPGGLAHWNREDHLDPLAHGMAPSVWCVGRDRDQAADMPPSTGMKPPVT